MDIKIINLLASFLLLIIPIIIFIKYKTQLTSTLLKSFSQMIVQLLIIALILQYLFLNKSILYTIGWLIVMFLFSILTLKKRLNIKKNFLWKTIAVALFAPSITILPLAIFVFINPNITFDARFTIPIYGMILGNSMNSLALGIERFNETLNDNITHYYNRLCFGATVQEACLPIMQKSMRASLLPRIINISSMGIITLPGMMTGQILAGASPFVAIKYQILIMILIFSSVSLSSYIGLLFFIHENFDKFYLPIKK